ncbi:MAG: methionine gamma-lyase family protein [Butyricicoccus sp.]
MVDNCYGEFTGDRAAAGRCGHHRRLAHQNPGSGLAPTSGMCRRADLVENASYKLTAPGIGGDRLYDGSEPPAVSGPVHGAACHHAGHQDRDVLRKGHGKARL